jgi:hypothetical protein
MRRDHWETTTTAVVVRLAAVVAVVLLAAAFAIRIMAVNHLLFSVDKPYCLPI